MCWSEGESNKRAKKLRVQSGERERDTPAIKKLLGLLPQAFSKRNETTA